MAKKKASKPISAGLLMFEREDEVRVLLAHPGGPYFAKKDKGAWSIPKGLVHAGEDYLETAQREFVEETGYELKPATEFISLESATLKSGKRVFAWAFEGTWEAGRIPDSNTFTIEWPPRSGKMQSFPEIDRAEMFTIGDARLKINERQLPFLERLLLSLRTQSGSTD